MISRRLDTLEADNNKLRIENAQLKERLNTNSSNSSLPPSKSFQKKKSNRHPSEKKAGGQPGHKGYYHALLPVTQVDFIQGCTLPQECLCGNKIKVSDQYMRHQVYELAECYGISITEGILWQL